jgi:hypothetical protein
MHGSLLKLTNEVSGYHCLYIEKSPRLETGAFFLIFLDRMYVNLIKITMVSMGIYRKFSSMDLVLINEIVKIFTFQSKSDYRRKEVTSKKYIYMAG